MSSSSKSSRWRPWTGPFQLVRLVSLALLVGVGTAAAAFSRRAAAPAGFVAPVAVPSRSSARHHLLHHHHNHPQQSQSQQTLSPARLFPSSPSAVATQPRARAGPGIVRRAALPPTLPQDVGGAALVAGAAGVWLKLWTTLATAGKVDSKDSRKIIHCGSGPLFLLCWPFFSADPSARFFAAAVPLLQIVAVSLAGLSKPSATTTAGGATTVANSTSAGTGGKPDGLVAAISRSGNPAEVLRGPLIYVFILLFATLLFWRTSPVGLVAVAQMAAGDGMADIVGRRWGRERKWPFSATKSYAGTAAFVFFGFLVSLGLLAWFHLFGLLPALTADMVGRVALISVACALVELVPLGDDNVTVPVAAALLSTLLLQ